MVPSNTLNKLLGGACLASMLALAGCAYDQPVEQSAPNAAGAKQEFKSDKAPADVKAKVTPAEQAVIYYATVNPLPITFDKLSIKLSDLDKEVLALIRTRALSAKQLTITGFCDQRQVGNPKAAAIARATAVKEELVRLGVDPKVITIKHVTTVPSKHAAEITL